MSGRCKQEVVLSPMLPDGARELVRDVEEMALVRLLDGVGARRGQGHGGGTSGLARPETLSQWTESVGNLFCHLESS